MTHRRNQIGQSGVGRQVSRHRSDRPGRQSAALGASEISTGSNMRVNTTGQLVINKARSTRPTTLQAGANVAALQENIIELQTSLNGLIDALKAAKLMER